MKPISLTLTLALLVLLPGTHLAAGQTRSAQEPPARSSAREQPPPRGKGLDALDDERVLTEIAGRGLADLLAHEMERQGVPEHRRRSLLSRISLNRLQEGEPVSTAERRELVRDVIANVEETVREASDPQLLFEQAQLLITKGVDEETRLLEYFGDNPSLRAYLKPVTEGIALMLTRAAELYQAEADDLANRISGPNDPALKQWEQADQLTQRVRDYRAFADYNRLLALDPEEPGRLQLGDNLIETVQPADNPQNPRRTFVKAYLGKVALARGNEKGLAMARDYLEQVIAESTDEAELFDAHFFRTVTEIQARDVPAARQQFQRFSEWFATQSLPDRKPLLLVLQYRLEDAAARYARTPPERDAAQAAATRVLIDLVEQYEGYRSIVTEQLLARVDASTDLWTLSPLLLDALVDRGRQEAALLAQKEAAARDGSPTTLPADVEPDIAAIERGIAAAEELMRRAKAGDEQVDPVAVARNAFLRGLMLDILGRNLEAAEAFVAFDEIPAADTQQQVSAFRRALGIIDELKAANPVSAEAARIDALEGRLLPLLVGPPVNDKSRAFDLANRLHRLGQLEDAAVFYRQVPETDPRRTDAAYLLLLAESSRLAEMNPTSPRRAAMVTELPRMGQATLAALREAMAEAAPENRDAYRGRIARVKVILARLALQEAKDPAAALEHLGSIEEDVAGLPDAEAILASALPLRFQATAATGRIDEATADLLAILERSDAQRGLAYIAQFRETLNRAMEEAESRDDAAAVAQLMQTRAAVTPRLVAWIEKSEDPEYRKYIYNFRRFDAETQHQAALAATDAESRRRGLQTALEAYRALQSDDNLARYRELLEGLTPEQRQSIEYDRDVVFALGNIHYDMGEYEEARAYYGRLLADRAMGNATRTIQQDGVARQVANNEFWELYLKFIRTNLALGNPPGPMRQQLKNLYATYGEHVGGTAWVEEFEALRRELLDDSQPSTQAAE